MWIRKRLTAKAAIIHIRVPASPRRPARKISTCSRSWRRRAIYTRSVSVTSMQTITKQCETMQLAPTALWPIKTLKVRHLWVLVKLRIHRANRCCLHFSRLIKTHHSYSNTHHQIKSLHQSCWLTKMLLIRQRFRILPIEIRPRRTGQAACKSQPVSMITITITILFSTARVTMIVKTRAASWLFRVNRRRQLRIQCRILRL